MFIWHCLLICVIITAYYKNKGEKMFNILFLLLISCGSGGSSQSNKDLSDRAPVEESDNNQDKAVKKPAKEDEKKKAKTPKKDKEITLTEDEKNFFEIIDENFEDKKYKGNGSGVTFYSQHIQKFVLDLFNKDLSESKNRGSFVLGIILEKVAYDNLVTKNENGNKVKSNLLRDLLINYSQYIEKSITVQLLGSDTKVLEEKCKCLEILCDYILVVKKTMDEEEFKKMISFKDKKRHAAINKFESSTDTLAVNEDLGNKISKVKEALTVQ